MEVIVAPRAGFCFGVRRAVELARTTAQTATRPVYTLGPLIHNPTVVGSLAAMGVKVVARPEEARGGVLIIRSHGVAPAVLAAAEELGITVVDATCPFVRRAQELAARLAREGYQVVLVGDPHHPEVEAVAAAAGGAMVVKEAGELDQARLRPRVGLLCQTTLAVEVFVGVVAAVAPFCRELLVYNTICTATAQRQKAALALAQGVEAMVVVGGRESANTRHLAELCRRVVPTYQVEGPEEIRPEWLAGRARIGLTAGASTPAEQIEAVKRRLTEMSQEGKLGKMTEERQGILNGQETEQVEGEGLLVGTRTLTRGEIVKARVVQVHDDLAFVDVGWKSDLPITKEELSLRPVASAKEVVRVGDEIEVMVVKADEEEGFILSKRRADQERRWQELQEALARGETVTGRVLEVVKGGLVVDVGVRGFVPASQADLGYVPDLARFVGETWTMRLLEVDRGKRRVVLSRRAVLEEERERAKEEVFARLKEGEVVEGRVTKLMSFGAFVDLGAGVEGLLHVSEIAWERVKDPAERLAVGQEVKVQVLKVDPETKKISLSLKALHPHPWTGVAERFPEGSILTGKVVRLAPFGAFVRVAEGIDGLVHVSQLAERRVAKPEEVVAVGQEVKVKVLKVDEANRRLSLSMRAVTEEAAKEEVKSFLAGQEEAKVTIAELVRQKQEG